MTLTGVVVDQAGNPIPGARLTAALVDASGLLSIRGRGGRVAAVTDAAGRFEITRQAAGPFEFTVSHDAHARATLEGATERAGDRLDGLRVELRAGASIAGAVTGLPGTFDSLRVEAIPAEGAQGGAHSFGVSRSRAPIEKDGTFTVKRLEQGQSYTLTVVDEEQRWTSFDRRSLPATARAGDRGVRLAYAEGGSVTFRLVDPSGRAVTEEPTAVGGFGDEDSMDLARVDGVPGAFRVAHLWPEDGKRFSMTVDVPGFMAWSPEAFFVTGSGEVDLGTAVLTPRPRVTVTVLDDATGRPVSGARVRLSEREVQDGGDGTRIISRTLSVSTGFAGLDILGGDGNAKVTDDEGRVVFDVTPGYEFTLTVTDDEHAELTTEAELLDPDMASIERTLRLGPGGAVHVRVVDAEGAPVRAFSVERASFQGGPKPGNARVDEAGEAWLRGLPAGTHRLRLEKKGGRGGVIAFGASEIGLGGDSEDDEGWTEVVVTAGEVTEVTLVAPTLSAVTGFVTLDGAPLTGARVRIESASAEGSVSSVLSGLSGGGLSGMTDARGEFRIEGVEPGAQRVIVSHSTLAMDDERAVDVEASEESLAIDLVTTTIRGRITGDDGEPIAGVRVEAKRKRKEGATRQVVSISIVTSSSDGELTFGSAGEATAVTTDADGRYELRGVASGTPLVVEAKGETTGRVTSDELELAPGEARDGVDLELPRTGTLDLTVDGGTGRALAILTRDDDPGGAPITRSVEGTGGPIKGLNAGTYTLRVQALAPGVTYTPETQTVEIEAGETAEATVAR